MSEVLEGLTTTQKKAVTFDGKALMIVAGAGTGKTTVLTRRITWLVEQGIKPEKILALTFTDKAAKEMETRVDQLLPYGVFGVEIGTFHSFCQKLLQQYPMYSHVSESTMLLTEAELQLFWQNHIMEFPLKSLRPLSNLNVNVGSIMHFISRCKDELISPEMIVKWIKTTCPDDDRALYGELASAYTFYQELIRKHNVLDYGELLFRTHQILATHKTLQTNVGQTYSHILIDEYQDTNRAQIEIIKLLATKNHSITVVGDDDQSIYRFRGAAVGQMEEFAQHFQAKIVSLTENFRSGQVILDKAYALIQHNNPHRLESKLHISKKLTQATNIESSVVSHTTQNDEDEATWITADIVKKITARTHAYDDFCILVRTNRQSLALSQTLQQSSIPFTTESNQGLAANKTVQLVLNFLKSVSNPTDHLALYFLATSPVYAIPGSTITPLLATSRDQHEPLENLLEGKNEAKQMLTDLHKARDLIPQGNVQIILTGWLQQHPWWQKVSQQAEFEAEQTAILTFLRLIHQFERTATKTDLYTFLSQVDVLLNDYSDQPSNEAEIGAVRLYTVHQAKGLEFPVVYVTNLTKDRFPTIDRHRGFDIPPTLLKHAEEEGEHLREERRLLYVAATRAKNELIFTRAEQYGITKPRPPSIFWSEIALPTSTVISIAVKRNGEIFKDFSTSVEMTKRDKTISLSPHSLDDYLQCPLRYRYHHIDHVPTPYNQNQMVGQCIHKAIEHYFTKRIAGDSVDLIELEQIIEACWSPRGFNSPEHMQLRKTDALQQMKQFVARFEALPLPQEIEKSFSVSIDQANLRGRIDAVFSSALPGSPEKASTIILDFKTTDRVSTQDEANKKSTDSLQLRLYALAWMDQHGRLPDAVGLYFTSSDLFGWTTPTQRKIDNSREKIAQIAEQILAGHFEATPDPFTCASCPFKQICPFSLAP